MTNNIADLEMMYRNLSGNPVARRIAATLLELEDLKVAAYEKAKQEYDGQLVHPAGVYEPFPWSGAEWFDLESAPVTLNALIVDGLLVTGGARGTYKSHSSQTYKLKDPELVRESLAQLNETTMTEPAAELPSDLFDVIIGHDDIKKLMWKALRAEKPVGILLCGPPATAKTLFMGEICRLPLSRFTNGSSTTKAGLTDFLLEFRPKYLVIDEIDKMALADMSILLSLMETGTITRMKHKMREIVQMQTWCFAGCNRDEHIWPELKSRFFRVELQEYTSAEFLNIACHVLVLREKVDSELAKYISTQLVTRTRDVRDAVHFGRLCKSVSDVDELMQLKWPGNRIS